MDPLRQMDADFDFVVVGGAYESLVSGPTKR